jgi:hypothetical protein
MNTIEQARGEPTDPEVRKPSVDMITMAERFLAGSRAIQVAYENGNEEREDFFRAEEESGYFVLATEEGEVATVPCAYLTRGMRQALFLESARRYGGSWASLIRVVDPCWLVHRALRTGDARSAALCAATAMATWLGQPEEVAEAREHVCRVLQDYAESLRWQGDDELLADAIEGLLFREAASMNGCFHCLATVDDALGPGAPVPAALAGLRGRGSVCDVCGLSVERYPVRPQCPGAMTYAQGGDSPFVAGDGSGVPVYFVEATHSQVPFVRRVRNGAEA